MLHLYNDEEDSMKRFSLFIARLTADVVGAAPSEMQLGNKVGWKMNSGGQPVDMTQKIGVRRIGDCQ